jgi:hypothetical protein
MYVVVKSHKIGTSWLIEDVYGPFGNWQDPEAWRSAQKDVGAKDISYNVWPVKPVVTHDGVRQLERARNYIQNLLDTDSYQGQDLFDADTRAGLVRIINTTT